MKKSARKILLVGCASAAAFCCGGAFLNGANIAANAETVSENVAQGFRIEETAAIRKVSPNGIRFTTNVDEQTKATAASLEANGYTITYGALLCPTHLVTTELTFETLADENECDIVTQKWQDEAQMQYTSVLAGKKNGDSYDNFLSQLYNTPISARGYMKAVNGTDTKYYYTENTAERSLAYVAAMAAADGDDSSLVTSIAQDVAFTMDAMTLTTDSAEGVVLYNALSHSQSAPIKLGGVATTSLSGVTYSVGDSSVVSVATDGTVTALKVGTTTITANYKGKTATANVTVNDELQPKSDYSILLAASATTTEVQAANTLKRAFEKAGVTLPIVRESGTETTQGKYISVGATTLAADNLTLSVTKDTASQVATTNNTVFIKGKTDNGTLYGVQQWLGDVLDYDYFMKDTYTVTAQTIALPEAQSYTPDIEHNVIDRNNDVRSEYGIHGYADGVLQVAGNIHNSTLILPYKTYGSSHSKWYARKGKYSWSGTYEDELCYKAQGYTTEYNAMVEAVATRLADELLANPEYTRVSFAVSDGNYICKCSACQNAGNTSDTFVPFLNDVCASVQTKLGTDSRANTFKVVTLAYHQTNAAPTKITSLDSYSAFKNHVELWFGDSYGDYTEGLKADSTSTKNQQIYTNFTNWINLLGGADAAADTLLWVYYTNTNNGFVPYNTFDAIRENYALAAANGVDYVFNQTIQAKSGWTMLKHYLISQLAWNATPDDDTWNGWITAYFNNAYGAGADAMLAWFNDWRDDDHSAYNTSDSNPAIHKDMVNTNNFPQATMEAWIAYANQAVAAIEASGATDAEKALYKKNVLLEKLSPEYFLVKLCDKATDYAEEFLNGVETWEIANLGEQVSMEATIEEFKAALNANALKVTTPSASSYYEFTGKSYVVSGSDYTFTVQATESRFDNLIVYVDGAVVALDENGSYTVSNVTSNLTIKVVHPYIEYGANASVEYGSDSIVFKMLQSTKNNDGTINMGWISADYINHMIGEGYTKISATVKLNDPTKANDGMIKSNDASGTYIDLSLWQADGTFETSTQTRTATLPETVSADLKFWLQLNTSCKNIEDVENGYMTITNFYFEKEDGTIYTLMPVKATVTKSTSSYYEIVGDAAAELGENYAFMVSPLVSGCDEFIVFVNDEEVTPNSDGMYVVENVQAALTIKVLHGYIEHGSNMTVTYKDDGSIEIKKITAGALLDENRNNWGWITADYLNYMIGKGYKTISLTVTLSDPTKANCALITGGSINMSLTQATDVFDTTKKSSECALGESVTEDLAFWLQHNESHWKVQEGGYMIITGLKFSKEKLNVTAPAASDYFTFTGASNVEIGEDYTFSVKSTDESKFSGFLVYVNDTLWTGDNGTYTVENVDTALTIKVVHGYIEHGAKVTVTYNNDGSIKIENAAYAYSIGTANEPWGAWISAEYVNYMMSKGYKTVQLYAEPDFSVSVRTIVYSSSSNKVVTDSNYTSIVELNLVKDSPIYVICTDKDNSGNAIRDKGGYTTITGLKFPKEKISVTAPATSSYYTFNGASSVEVGADYTFTLTATNASCNEFIVLVDGEEVTPVGGVYTVKNVTSAPTIKVLHGYIECDTANGVTVTYNSDGTITVKNAIWSKADHGAWISADYINYMIGKGYTYFNAVIVPDGTIADVAYIKHNDANNTTITKDANHTISLGESATHDMWFWVQKGNSGGAIINQGGYMTILGMTFSKETVAVTAPAENTYYTFNGATSVAKGGTYTFSLTANVENCDEFIVLVDGVEVAPVGGKYTVKNVQSALTIEVLHGYIECDTANGVTVTYNSDGTITVKNAIWPKADHGAWISADYINYMIGKGYKYFNAAIVPDGTIAAQALVQYNSKNIISYTDETKENSCTADLGESALHDMWFWVQNSGGSGGQIAGKGGYMTILGMTFSKETVAVTAPAENTYYTFNGATSVAKGGTYTFSLTANVENCDEFIVLVDGVEVTPVGGKYTVKNVQSALTIEVLHGYIEHGKNVTVTYNDDGSVTIKDAVYANNGDFGAWISADYINYMIEQGATKVQVYMQADYTTVAASANIKLGTGNERQRNSTNDTAVAELPLIKDEILSFFVLNGDNLGTQIQGDGGTMKVTSVTFA